MNKLLLGCIILLAAFSRLAPHPPNFTPILSIALFSGFCFKNNYAFIVPLSIMLVSDYFIGSFEMALWVYPPILLIFYLGNSLMKKNSYKNILFGSIVSSLIFFLITNFGSWYGNLIYLQNFNGLLSSYVAGIPFYKNTLISTILYSSILFSVHGYLLKKYNHQYQSL